MPIYEYACDECQQECELLIRGSESGVSVVWNHYANAFADHRPPSFRRAARYAGIELLRRTLGAARAPGVDRDDCALRVLEFGIELVKSPPDQAG